MRLSILVGLAVLVVVAAVAFFWSTGGAQLPDAIASSTDDAGPTPAKTLDLEGEPSEAARSTATAASPSTSEVAPTPSTVEPPSIGIGFGLLIITDVDGRELKQESGEIELRALADGRSEFARIPFENGTFSLAGFSTGRYRIEGAKGGGKGDARQVVFKEPEFAYSPGERLILRGAYLRDTLLYVVDAATSVPLANVSVLVKRKDHAGAEQNHPGPHGDSDFCVKEKPSPVRLPRVRGIRSYWATANGYAWSIVQVDHESGGEREVRLERGVRLEVQVVGNDTMIPTYFRLRARDSQRVVTSALVNEGGWQGFTGIAPGEYDARVEVGPADGELVVLGETRATIRPGEVAKIRIELDEDPIPPLVPVKGVLLLPTAHAELRPSLRIRPAVGPAYRLDDVKLIGRDSMSRENATGFLRWNAGHLTPGRYLFIVEPVGYGVVILVPQAPLEDVRIEVPDLYPVIVCALDVETRKPVDAMKLRWSREIPVRSGVHEIFETEAETGQGCVNLLVPAGPISLSARGVTHGEQSMDTRIGAVANRFTLELPARIPREIVLYSGDTRIPWMQGVRCTFRNVRSTVATPCERVGEAGMRALFEAPGVYELVVGPFPGFRQPAPVEVSVDEGTDVPIVIQLAR